MTLKLFATSAFFGADHSACVHRPSLPSHGPLIAIHKCFVGVSSRACQPAYQSKAYADRY